MKFEQYHRRSKLTSNVSGSFKNIIHTLAHKSQLKLCYLMLNSLKKSIEFPEGSAISDDEHKDYFSLKDKNLLKHVKYATVMGIRYKPGMIVVEDAVDLPTFGLIKKKNYI